jgi:Zn ribbon nucleic-acid-binding protein
MSFLGFHPCPKCSSRDNLAEYANNFYCFGCGFTEQKKDLTSLRKRLDASKETRVCNGITLQKELPLEAKKWLLGYSLTLDEMQQFKYSKERVINNELRPCNLLVLIASDSYWLARNLDAGARYLSSGIKPYREYKNSASLYPQQDTIVFVEDVISAVKVGRVATAVPMLGAAVLRDWWKHTTPYKRVILWGDRDKASQNITLAKRASELIGKRVEVLVTEKDPKEYSTIEINNYLTRV